jgi:hypothetical protein
MSEFIIRFVLVHDGFMNKSIIGVIYVRPVGFVFVPDGAFTNKTVVIDCSFI